jgi:1,4-alpha-glucan branching enzyme
MVTVHDNGYAEFRFFRPNAAKVFVAGDFNDWRTDQLRMVRLPDGHWSVKLLLPAGEYKFRYVADGFWYTDYAAFGVEPDHFGFNSLLRVPARTLRLNSDQPQTASAAAAA